MGPNSTISLPSVFVNEFEVPSSLPVCAVGGWALADSLMQAGEISLNPLPLCLYCREKLGTLSARPCPREQGALGERPGPTQGWAPTMPSAQRQEGSPSLSGRVMGRPSRWKRGVGALGVTTVLEKTPQERLVQGSKDTKGKPVF